MSSFTWLDYSERDRRKMLDVVSQFGDRDTRDELGLGSVRDAFADMLFPGTSTIQTRARYFLFVPWIYLRLERERVSPTQIKNRARDAELDLIDVIEDSEDPAGNIGRIAGRKLQRLPSHIYWMGLERWGIRRYIGSQDQYRRSLTGFYNSTAVVTARTRSHEEGFDISRPSNWHPALPVPPSNFPDQASMQLRHEEAVFLRERLLERAPETLLTFLVCQCSPSDPTEFPWEHPDIEMFPQHLREQLVHARNFAEALHGASLLYNLLLAEQRQWDERIDLYKRRLRGWRTELEVRHDMLQAWDRVKFWSLIGQSGARVPSLARGFIDQWLDLILSPTHLPDVSTDNTARERIAARERQLKGKLARLSNTSSLAQWNGAAGAERLQYRWPSAWNITNDIQRGLLAEASNA